MKQDVKFRIIVEGPLPGVAMNVQRGRDELLPPSSSSRRSLIFEFDISVDLSGGKPNFLGKYAQGPKDARFIYVNAGTFAGDAKSCWSRRAKLSLMSVSKEQIAKVLAEPGSWIETSFRGVGRDGGPTCASVKGIAWKVVAK